MARGPGQLPPATNTSPNGGGQAVVETSEGFMTFHARMELVRSGFSFSNTLTASFQRHDASGALIGGPVTLFENLNAGTPRPQDALKAVELADGRIVVVVADLNPPALPAGEVTARFRAIILNPNGSISQPEFAIRRAPDLTSGTFLPFFSLNALEDGGFVIGYNINGSFAHQTMAFQVYGANGQPEEFQTFTYTLADAIAGLSGQQDYARLRGDGTGLTPGALAAEAFVANDTGQATSAAHRLIYDTDTGALYFDADGRDAGARVQFATLAAGLALTEADFLVI